MELRAEEFRIGNWVRILNGISKYYYHQLNRFDIYKMNETDSIDTEPIPLTEEILLLCGFDLIGECFFISKLPSIFLKKPFIGADYLLIKSNGGDQLTSIRYLHQLQNLYYCLCGEELNIKL